MADRSLDAAERMQHNNEEVGNRSGTPLRRWKQNGSLRCPSRSCSVINNAFTLHHQPARYDAATSYDIELQLSFPIVAGCCGIGPIFDRDQRLDHDHFGACALRSNFLVEARTTHRLMQIRSRYFPITESWIEIGGLENGIWAKQKMIRFSSE